MFLTAVPPASHRLLCDGTLPQKWSVAQQTDEANRISNSVLHGFGLGAAGCWMTVICTIPMFVASCGLASRDCNAVRGRRAPVSNPRGTDTCMPASRAVLVTVRKLQGALDRGRTAAVARNRRGTNFTDIFITNIIINKCTFYTLCYILWHARSIPELDPW